MFPDDLSGDRPILAAEETINTLLHQRYRLVLIPRVVEDVSEKERLRLDYCRHWPDECTAGGVDIYRLMPRHTSIVRIDEPDVPCAWVFWPRPRRPRVVSRVQDGEDSA